MEDYMLVVFEASFGLLLAVIGFYMLYKDRRIKQNGTKTLATVIELKELKSRDGVSYKQVVEFQNSKGEKIVQELDFSSSIKPKEEVPFKTPIYYQIKNGKTKIVLANNNIKLIVSYGFLAIGIVILCIIVYNQLL